MRQRQGCEAVFLALLSQPTRADQSRPGCRRRTKTSEGKQELLFRRPPGFATTRGMGEWTASSRSSADPQGKQAIGGEVTVDLT